MKKRIFALMMVAAMSLSLLVGCTSPEEQAAAPAEKEESAEPKDASDVKIGLAMNTTTNAWRAALVAKAQETADAAGATLIVLDAAGKAD